MGFYLCLFVKSQPTDKPPKTPVSTWYTLEKKGSKKDCGEVHLTISHDPNVCNFVMCHCVRSVGRGRGGATTHGSVGQLRVAKGQY